MMGDPLAEGARLITEFGRCYARARRYRAIAAECEERLLARALAIGGDLRAWARDDDPDRDACAAAVHELSALLRACDVSIATVHASAPYRAALRARDAGDWNEVAARAPAIFDAIEPLATTGPLHYPLTIAGARGGAHFLAPAAVAAQALDLARDGLPAADPVPDLGADESLRAVVLEPDAGALDVPISLVVAPEDVPVPLFRLVPGGEVLIYVPCLRAPTRVRCAAWTTDEWWAVRPDAYAAYVTELVRELAQRGITAVERG